MSELEKIINSFINTTTNDPKIAENLEVLLNQQENSLGKLIN